jgi:hypothetical protein
MTRSAGLGVDFWGEWRSVCRRMRRPFLVPLSLAIAALGPQGALASQGATAEASPAGADANSSSARMSERFRQPLLAVSRAPRHLATYLGHSSHSSHASHASHASHSSHFSSSGSAPAVPTPSPPVVVAPTPAPAPATAAFFSARLSVSQEVPQPAAVGSGALGLFSATLTGRILQWQLTVSQLSGTAGAAVIRVAPKGAIGPQLIRLCEPCADSAHGTLVLSAAQASKLLTSSTYVNVGTHTNPHGEIRGQIQRG